MKRYRFLIGAMIPGMHRDGKPIDFKTGDVVDGKAIPSSYIPGWLTAGILEQIEPPAEPARASDAEPE